MLGIDSPDKIVRCINASVIIITIITMNVVIIRGLTFFVHKKKTLYELLVFS